MITSGVKMKTGFCQFIGTSSLTCNYDGADALHSFRSSGQSAMYLGVIVIISCNRG
jgi:hypothetical protein